MSSCKFTMDPTPCSSASLQHVTELRNMSRIEVHMSASPATLACNMTAVQRARCVGQNNGGMMGDGEGTEEELPVDIFRGLEA